MYQFMQGRHHALGAHLPDFLCVLDVWTCMTPSPLAMGLEKTEQVGHRKKHW